MSTITIIGTGLIGTSMGTRFRECGHFTIGCDLDKYTLDSAFEMGAFDAITTSYQSAVEQSDAVILATPVDSILRLLPEILNVLPEDAVLIDTGSTKRIICESVRNHSLRDSFVAAHPMAGSEKAGPGSSSPNLFENRNIAICDAHLSSQLSLAIANHLFTQLGLTPIYLSPQQHDSVMALVSHVPQLMAYAFAALPHFEGDNTPLWEKLASSGFDSSTRLSVSIPEVWLPILNQNKESVVDILRNLSRNIDFLADSICCNDAPSVLSMMQNAAKTRKRFDTKQINQSLINGAIKQQ